MADDNDVKGPKTKPLRKTSAVPLRKETVRVTLKATPAGASGGARPPAPAPPKPPSVATTPLETTETEDLAIDNTAPVTVSNEAALPDVTAAVPLRQETMRVTLKSDNSGAPMAPAPSPAAAKSQSSPTVPLTAPNSSSPANPAPTIPLDSAPSVPQPAPTIPLGNVGIPQPAATVPIATQPIGSPTASSQPLPKATVELQQTQQLGAPLGGAAQMPSLQTQWEEEIDRGLGMIKILSIAAFVVALAALGVQLMHSKHWLDQYKDGQWKELTNAEVKFKKKKSANDYVKKY